MGARSIKSAIEFVSAHVKDTGRLAYWNLRGQRCSFSPWHGYLPTTFDYQYVGGEGERPSYVLREIDRHPWICVAEE